MHYARALQALYSWLSRQLAGMQEALGLEGWQQRALVSTWALARRSLADLRTRKAGLLRSALVRLGPHSGLEQAALQAPPGTLYWTVLRAGS